MPFLFVRHGECTLSGTFCGLTDAPLTPKGIQQTERAAQILADHPLDICYASPLQRTLQTATQITRARQIPVVERYIRPEELGGFSECFLTGTAAEVTPVSEIGPHRFTPAAITKTLMDDYHEDVRKEFSAVNLSASE